MSGILTLKRSRRPRVPSPRGDLEIDEKYGVARRYPLVVVRSSSSLLFTFVLCLSFALLAWWATFLLFASADLTAAGEQLLQGDVDAAARALGAPDANSLAEVGERRKWMFASEAVFFAIVLAVCGALFLASVRREAALRANQDRFLAAATHELKTPLATISLLLESLHGDRVPAEKRQRYLTNGLLEAERLERGLHNVLKAAGLRSAGATTVKTDGDLAADVRTAVEAMQARALAAEVRLEVEAPDAMPAPRDAAAIQLVARNLLENAIKFSPAHTTVRVQLERVGDNARMRVEDAGRGLDDEERRRAFEPFWRGDDRSSGGTGLGLHLVQEMVAAHGGAVRADSPGRDQGSTFVVDIPLEGGA
ncbi:MAG: HAMP domain-containing sensor histidine kinase [Planctomycetota bacterium]|nr:HAMP domain-containing sensor histidine kinase [Planctomycetota bacterium]